jgi:hypothetical protein
MRGAAEASAKLADVSPASDGDTKK